MIEDLERPTCPCHDEPCVRGGRQWKCAHKARADAAARRARVGKEQLAHENFVQRLRHYGLTLAAYLRMAKKQDGVCAICKKPPKKNRLAVDHCHESGRVRGLLCVRCNTALEWVLDHREAFEAYASR